MDEEIFAMVQKINHDVNSVISKNAELCAFDVVPVEINLTNKSPVLHLDNCLKLESWCVKRVYEYCYKEIMDKYFPKLKRKSSKPTSVNSEKLIQLLNITLLLNPDVSSFWNKRREIITCCPKNMLSELLFTKLVLSWKPKCNEAFTYRQWILPRIFKDGTIQNYDLENLINEELQICELASDKGPNNSNSWNHRMWFVNTLKNMPNYCNLGILYTKEYEFSTKWTSEHVSDYSCFNYRQFCLRNLVTIDDALWKIFESTTEEKIRRDLSNFFKANVPNENKVQTHEENKVRTHEDVVHSIVSYTGNSDLEFMFSDTNNTCHCLDTKLLRRRIAILLIELVLNNLLVRSFKYHETLWYHRRFIMCMMFAVMYNNFGLLRQNGVLVKKPCGCSEDESQGPKPKMAKYDNNQIYSSLLYKILLFHESKFIQERRNDGDNNADRYEKYLKLTEGFPHN